MHLHTHGVLCTGLFSLLGQDPGDYYLGDLLACMTQVMATKPNERLRLNDGKMLKMSSNFKPEMSVFYISFLICIKYLYIIIFM